MQIKKILDQASPLNATLGTSCCISQPGVWRDGDVRDYLIVVAHGSRRQTANHDVVRRVHQLAELLPDFDVVDYAFLELAEPSLPSVLQKAVCQGAQRVVVLPYFLASGVHVLQDIPAIVAAQQKRSPATDFIITSCLGEAGALLGVLAKIAQQR